LVAYPKGAPQRWYQRTFNASKGSYEWAKASTAFDHDKSLQDKTRENSLFLSVGPQFNHTQLTQVFNWFKDGLHFIDLGVNRRMGHGFTAERIKNPMHHDRIIHLLRSADFGVADVTAQEKEVTFEEMKQTMPPALVAKLEKEHGPEPLKGLEINLTHRAEGIAPVTLDFDDEESDGTRRFFALVGPWLDILDNGYTVFVDEIETSLHPILVRELLKLLFCSKNNPKGAQIVFTTHNPVFLDSTLMRRDQVWFTEKSPSGETHLYPLTDYQPRKDEALAKGYLAGRYGAVPFLGEGLKL
jgi:hypothetical protein